MKRTAGNVTSTERQQAVLHDRDRAAVERIGVPEAARIGFRLQRDVLAAVRRGEGWGNIRQTIFRPQLAKLHPLVVSGMVAGHLAGIARVFQSFGGQSDGTLSLRKAISESETYSNALELLRRRAGLTKDQLDALVAKYQFRALQVLEKATAAVEEKLQTALIETTAGGKHVREGVKAMREAFDAAGITPDNSYTLENLFRTQTQFAYAAGRWQTNQDEAIQEILWGYKYVTVGDDRVRPEHVGLDGTTAPKDDPVWLSIWPPNGFSCRCSTLELFEERAVKQPPATVEIDGKEYTPRPDKGFDFNPGQLFAAGAMGA